MEWRRLVEPDGPRGEGNRAPSPWSYAGLGVEVAVPVILGLYGGYRLDVWLGTDPWLVALGGMLGLGLSFYVLFRRTLTWGTKDG